MCSLKQALGSYFIYFRHLFQGRMCCPLECAHLSQLTTQGQNLLILDYNCRQLLVMNLTLSVLALSLKKMVMQGQESIY